MTGAEEFITAITKFEIAREYPLTEIVHAYRVFGGTKGDPIPSDYCYNCTNDGIDFTDRSHRLFEKVRRGVYKYLGANYPYNGAVTHTDRKGKISTYGRWDDGVFVPSE